jgi:hypothetical protein
LGAAPTNPVSTINGGAFGGGNGSEVGGARGTTQTNGADGVLSPAVQQVWFQMDAISEKLDEETFYRKIMFSAVVGSSTAASAGLALWTLRAGYFTAMLLTATPTWATFDVVPLLNFEEVGKQKGKVPAGDGDFSIG